MFKAFIKLNVLKELDEVSLSGYDLMKFLGQFGEKPSPGYIYPLLNDLETKGFISVKQDNRRKIYSLTKKGKKLLDELQKNRQDMLRKMTKFWKAIADREEIDDIIKSKVQLHKNKGYLKDMDILVRFHKALFSAYKKDDSKRTREIKRIINDCIKKVEGLR